MLDALGRALRLTRAATCTTWPDHPGAAHRTHPWWTAGTATRQLVAAVESVPMVNGIHGAVRTCSW